MLAISFLYSTSLQMHGSWGSHFLWGVGVVFNVCCMFPSHSPIPGVFIADVNYFVSSMFAYMVLILFCTPIL